MRYFPFDKLEQMKYTVLKDTVDICFAILIFGMVYTILTLLSDRGK